MFLNSQNFFGKEFSKFKDPFRAVGLVKSPSEGAAPLHRGLPWESAGVALLRETSV